MSIVENLRLPIERMGALVKVGEGEIGGKARGFPFLESLVDLNALSDEFSPHLIRVPETWVLATDIFDEFVARNGLGFCLDVRDDALVKSSFLKGSFSAEVIDILAEYCRTHQHPIAVRSSAVSEDAYNHPAAGLYETLMVPNCDPEFQLIQLQQAIKLVYASTFSEDASRYLSFHNIPRENEKMAVILEEVVGSRNGNAYYPLVSGVAQSVNFFPVGNMKPEDGAATIVLGLGRKVMDGRGGMRFCPRFPTVRPQIRNVGDFVAGAQQDFDAVDLSQGARSLTGPDDETIVNLSVEAATDGELNDIASVLDEESGILYEGIWRSGARVLTFDRLLRQSVFPLPAILTRLLDAVEYGFGAPVEIEFALTMEEENGRKRGVLNLLQARRMSAMEKNAVIEIPNISTDELVLNTNRAMGHGKIDRVSHVVYVGADDFLFQSTTTIANEIAAINDKLLAEKIPYILVGPGRWGSCNKAVGIPVTYSQVSGARVIAELSTEEIHMEPSQGTHFFHNVVSGGVFYFTVDDRDGGFINFDWLRAQKNVGPGIYAKLFVLDRPLAVFVNGKTRRGVVCVAESQNAAGQS